MRSIIYEKTLLATAAVTASVTLVNQVQADEVQVSSQTYENQLSVTKTVTKEDFDRSNAELAQANQAVESQNKVVGQATVDANKAQDTKAVADKLVQEATPEAIKNAEEKVVANQTAQAKAEATLKEKQAVEAKAKADQAEQTRKTDKAKAVVQAKDVEVAEAKKTVAEKEAILNGTGAKQVLDNQKNAKDTVEEDKKMVAMAQASLEVAKKADRERELALASAEKEVVSLKNEQTEKEAILAEKMKVSVQTEATLKTATEAKTQADNAVKYLNQLTLSPAYIEALKKNDQATLAKESEKLRKAHQYKSNPSDDNTKTYTLNEVPSDVLEDLSQFASDLINQARKQVGTPLTSVTKSSIEFAENVVKQTVADNWDAWTKGGHNEKGLTKVAKEYHLKDSDTEGNFYEDWSGIHGNSSTKAQLKEQVYQSLLRFLFPAGDEYLEWDHANDVLGTKDDSASYMGLAFSYVNGHSGLHLLNVKTSQLTAQSTNFSKTAIENPYNSEWLLTKQQVAQSNYDTAIASNDTAQAAKTNAQTAFNTVSANLTQATTKRDSIKNQALQTPTAQANLKSVQDKLALDESTLAKANKAVKELNADIKAKQANLADAQAVLKTKEAELATLNTTLKAEQEVLTAKESEVVAAQKGVQVAQADLTQAQNILTSSEKRVVDLKNAPKILAEAEKVLAEKTAILKAEIKKLDELKATQKEVAFQNAKVVKAYQEYLEAERQAELAKQYQAIKQAGGEPVPVVNAKGEITGYVDGKKATPLVVKPVAKALPKTGQSMSLFAIYGMIVGAFSLLFQIKNMRNKEY
ncbi:conserved domain protein [Streptococcus sp. oral taxon 056 str. F0418]|uniref:SEC10/PgrA surface exclusion domain-containing protein n=1 Tax=Streptococcus sp. oral taxon 056 TaxID=712620 RepID=UPI00021806F8|nr:SEC10/PgrA surface exclusion domain-containing protein [Streptococcus sp. oral taxon 056]EGP65809.1 conserved domain protein [Streptococcus sp. oral taxon 056 str. F0418]